MNKTAYLKKVPLFAGFGGSDARKLEKICGVQAFRKGDAIFSEDAAGDSLYIVALGRVKIYTSSGKKKKTLAYLEEGEFFGEMALLDRERRSASSIALENCELLVIKKKNFQDLLLKHPRISLLIMETLSRRLRQADKEIESLAFGDVLGRVAAALAELSARYGETTGGGLRIGLPLNHRDIAELAGTGREMVSRILNRFRRLRCITYNERFITITNAEKLKEFSGRE